MSPKKILTKPGDMALEEKHKSMAEESKVTAAEANAAIAEEEAHHHHHDHDHDHDHEHHHDHGHDHEKPFEFVEEPSFEIEYKGDCAYEVKVSVPPANETKQAEEVLSELRDGAELPGFRRGKAPRWLLERKFGKAVRGDVTEKLVTAAFQKLIKDKDLKPIALPDVDGLKEALEREEGTPLAFTLKFEVAPRCELGKYRGIEIERPVLEITEKDVDEALESLRERAALYESFDGKAENGDQVIISFRGTIDGEDFPGGRAENYPYILGSGRFFKEFEDALTGAQAGSNLGCQVSFPEDYSAPALRGKTADFSIEVHEVKRRVLPALDDAFASEQGFDSLQALREDVKKDLQEGSNAQSQRVAENKALTQIIEGSTFELPRTMVNNLAKQIMDDEIRERMRMRVPISEIEAQMEALKQKAEEAAVRQIKAYVVINEIGEAEGIEVHEEDFEAEAGRIGRPGANLAEISRLLQSGEYKDEYRERIFRRKALAVVMDNAKITDKPVSREELDKKDEEIEAEA